MDLEINANRVLSNRTALMPVTYTCMFLMTPERTDLMPKSLLCFSFFSVHLVKPASMTLTETKPCIGMPVDSNLKGQRKEKITTIQCS